jgi:excisionase family DNA binding protein
MLIELDNNDYDNIADKVMERLKPLLKANFLRSEQEDIIFTVDELASYLKVTKSWVYERTHLNEIPYYKVGKFIRFRKKDVDRWLEENKVVPTRIKI